MTLEELVDKLIEIQNDEDYVAGATVKLVDQSGIVMYIDDVSLWNGFVYIDPQ